MSATYAVNTNLLFGIARCRLLRENARQLLLDDIYRNPGPLQFDGPGADSRVMSLCIEDLDYMGRIKKLNEYLEKVLTLQISIVLPSLYSYSLLQPLIFLMFYGLCHCPFRYELWLNQVVLRML